MTIEKHEVKRKINKIAIFAGVAFFFLLGHSKNVFADVLKDPYEFYTKYGKQTVFIPVSETDGEICFGTAGGSASSSDTIRYSTVGWQVCVYDAKGKVIQKVIMKKDGFYLKKAAPMREVKSVKYNLYSVSLAAVLNNLNDNAKAVLKKSSSKIKLNACMVVVKNGVASGSVSDAGKITGKVYTDYESICNAVNWSAETKEYFKSYYDKQIVDLYRNVLVEATKGIKSVSGSGEYLYGTSVTIKATADTGYDFAYWVGTDYFDIPKVTIRACDDIDVQAYARPKSIEVLYFMKEGDEDYISQRTYYYGQSNQLVEPMPFDYKGHRFQGWSYQDANGSKGLKPNDPISDELILNNLPMLAIYGRWKINSYSFKFVVKETNRTIRESRISYENALTTPTKAINEEKKLGARAWYTYYNGKLLELENKSMYDMAWIAEYFGVEYENEIEFVFYPIWAGRPRISAADYFFSLDEAKKGKITEELLARYSSCSDENDGNISYGIHENNKFVISSFNFDKYKQLNESCTCEETFLAKNSLGSENSCTVQVHIVDSSVPEKIEVKEKKVRFVSEKYIINNDNQLRSEAEGGLKSDSIWRTGEYVSLLLGLFKKGSA